MGGSRHLWLRPSAGRTPRHLLRFPGPIYLPRWATMLVTHIGRYDFAIIFRRMQPRRPAHGRRAPASCCPWHPRRISSVSRIMHQARATSACGRGVSHIVPGGCRGRFCVRAPTERPWRLAEAGASIRMRPALIMTARPADIAGLLHVQVFCQSAGNAVATDGARFNVGGFQATVVVLHLHGFVSRPRERWRVFAGSRTIAFPP